MKPVITDIDPEKLEELEAELKTIHTPTFKMKTSLMKKYVGTCVSCYDIPTKIVTYDVGDDDMGAKRVERYCPKCFVKLTATNGIDEVVAEKVEKNYTDRAQ
jgi:hypothetical protein